MKISVSVFGLSLILCILVSSYLSSEETSTSIKDFHKYIIRKFTEAEGFGAGRISHIPPSFEFKGQKNMNASNFHNYKTEKFTEAEGFGVGRMPIKSKHVPPSIAAVEQKSMNISDFHNYKTEKFTEAEGFGVERTSEFYAEKIPNLRLADDSYSLINMSLLSVTDRKKPVMWSSVSEPYLHEFNKDLFTNLRAVFKKRELTTVERVWVNDLKNGKEHILLQEKSKTKLIAPLFAQVGCVKCHDTYSTGDFMGAFVYDFVLPVVNEFPKTKL